MHKQGQGNHINAERFAQLDFDNLWDTTWGEMEKIQKIRHNKATPAQAASPRTAPMERPFEVPSDWPTDVPVPPRPQLGPEEKRRMFEEGWLEPVPAAVVELLSFAAYQKAKLSWIQSIGMNILDRLVMSSQRSC